MAISRKSRVGIILIIGGILLYGCWFLWAATRITTPLSMPISLAVGRVRSREFRVNINDPYLVEIEVERKIPFYTLNCLLGLHMGPATSELSDCPDRPSVIKVTWSALSGGQVVASGSSDDSRSGDWGGDTVGRIIGDFEGRSGRRYVLEANVLADGSALAAGNPRLVVEVAGDFSEGELVLNALFQLGSGLLVLTGIVLLATAWRKRRRARAA